METKMTFETALSKLEEIVRELEKGDLPLDKSLEKYQEGMRLAKFCHEEIQNAENVIVKLMKDDKLEDFEEPKE
ncbi:MAG TPA: exodeoxyribonuclease VII small subunit [Bacillota bacterium]|nr:exodeoxyribonuclease VII small subunit [Bacillota bacterium]HPF42409.1 exodeoxyribonuclease VII small subunit [Bacillota bacterium]HPJ85378.1 exodeoxyribonuclease VII small subunit [Bacillota bacterium]HPQ61326.1 exodeoxyribonuclease VII small subunit [Bacillota bacterium]HRX91427.1 exodeoxyribonuclease VII small subunit [Candidatus Izemoplasmatales bacterium]